MTARAREVVVVGAGLAGLAAAARLARAGLRVRVFERAERAGGRVRVATWRGVRIDPTAACVSSSDASLLALIREAGLAPELLPLRPWVSLQVRDAQGRAAPVAGGGLLAAARAPGVRRLDALRLVRLGRLLARHAPHLDPAAPERAAPLDDRSLRDFGELYFGASAVAYWMEPWLAERAPVEPGAASRAAFLLRWRAEADASPGALREPPGLLAELLAARLRVETGTGVAGVESAAGGRVRVAIETAAGAAACEADAVVLAVPAPEACRLAAPLLTTAERDRLGAVRYDPAIAWIGGAGPLPVSVPTRVRIPAATGAPLLRAAFEPAAGPGGPGGRVVAIARAGWCRAREDAADDAVAKELADAVARHLPGAPAPFEGDACLRRWPAAWPRFDVGCFRALARLREVQQDRRRAGRRLYLAGDWLVAPTLEGAVASGLRAAGDCLADLG